MAILRTDPFNYMGNSEGIKIITTEDMGKEIETMRHILIPQV